MKVHEEKVGFGAVLLLYLIDCHSLGYSYLP